VVVSQIAAEAERPRQDGTLTPPPTFGQMALRNLKHPVTATRTIAVVEDYVALVREGVLAVVVIPMRWVEGVDSPEGGVEEDPVVVVEGRVLCGPARKPDLSTVFIGNYLL